MNYETIMFNLFGLWVLDHIVMCSLYKKCLTTGSVKRCYINSLNSIDHPVLMQLKMSRKEESFHLQDQIWRGKKKMLCKVDSLTVLLPPICHIIGSYGKQFSVLI